MTRKIIRLSIFFIVTFTTIQYTAQSNSDYTETNVNTIAAATAIEKIVSHYAQNNVFEGLVLVEKSGNVIFEKAYGSSDRKDQKAFELGSVMPIASLTKPITSALVLMLCEQGKLHLNDTLANFFTEFENKEGREITLHHLLSHTSGIPNHFSIDRWFVPEFHDKTSDEEFVTIISSLPLSFIPGTDYQYSNPGYFLLGKIIESVTGQAYHEVFERMIFTPLKMKDTTFVFDNPSNSVKGYQWKTGGGYREQSGNSMRLLGAGGAIQSSVGDLFRFQQALYGANLISKNSRDRIFHSSNPYSWKINNISIAPNSSVTMHSYDGKFDGHSTMLTRFVDDQHSIIIMSNTGTSYQLKQQLTLDIASALYELPVSTRNDDIVFALIKDIVEGNFEKKMKSLDADLTKIVSEEHALSALGFELLWSGLADESLQLFSFIKNEFEKSNKAKENLLFACDNRLTSKAKTKLIYCK